MYGDDSKHWYVVGVRPNSGVIAVRNLVRQGFDTFMPMEIRSQRKGTQFIEVRKALFPGYVFVGVDALELSWRKLNSTYGVTRVVSFGNVPARIPNQLIHELKSRCDPAGLLLPIANLSRGDAVVLKSGPFVDFVATVESHAADQRIWVMLELMGSQTRILTPSEHLSSIA